MTEKEKIKIVFNFLQWILDAWELDTLETQEKALEIIKKIKQMEGVE